jgi:hypothetical protein
MNKTLYGIWLEHGAWAGHCGYEIYYTEHLEIAWASCLNINTRMSKYDDYVPAEVKIVGNDGQPVDLPGENDVQL